MSGARGHELQRGLKQRHMTMIALGGIIGAGLYPWLTWFSIVAIAAVIGSMAFVNDDATRAYLVPSLISLAIVLAVAFGRERLPRRQARAVARRRRGTAATA